MRKLSARSILLAIPAILFLFSSFIVVEPKSVHVIFNQGQIMLKIQDTKSDSVMLTPEWSSLAFVRIFGDFDRNTSSISTYDNLGLNVWKSTSNKVSEFHVNLYIDKSDAADDNDYNPKNAFTGTFKIDGCIITADVTPSKLKSQLIDKGWKSESCSLSHNYKLTKKGIYIYFQYNPGEDKLEFAAIGVSHY